MCRSAPGCKAATCAKCPIGLTCGKRQRSGRLQQERFPLPRADRNPSCRVARRATACRLTVKWPNCAAALCAAGTGLETGTYFNRVSHTFQSLFSIGFINPHYLYVRAHRPPAVEHTRHGKAAKYTDQRNAARRRDMLSRRIVTDVQLARRDNPGEPGE